MLDASGMMAQWSSVLYPGDGSRPVVEMSGRAWQLEDYSYAGYALGERAPGVVPCRVKTVEAEPGAAIGAALQAAVDEIGSAGGGVVRIPEGEYLLEQTVTVRASRVRVVGAGRGRTVLRVPSSWDPVQNFDEGVITFGKAVNGWNQGWVHQGRLLGRIETVVERGAMTVEAPLGVRVEPGTWVVVQQYFWPGLVDRNSVNPGRWPDAGTDRFFSFSYLRRVVAQEERQLRLDAPIPWTLDPANNPVLLRLTDGRMLEDVGIEGVTIEFEPNANGDGGRPGGAAVHFEGVRDGWVSGVEVKRFPRIGLQLRGSARITLEDSTVENAQDYGDGGYGYGVHVHSSQNVLVRRVKVEDARRPFTLQRALTSMVVFTRCESANATQGDDTHHSFIHSLLWDRHAQRAGTNLTLWNRADFSDGAHETLGSGAVWNHVGDGVRGRLGGSGGQIHVKPSPDGWAMVIGTSGHPVFDGSQGNPFRAGRRVTGMGPEVGVGVWYEGIGQAGLQPESLWEAQLQARTGGEAPKLQPVCEP